MNFFNINTLGTDRRTGYPSQDHTHLENTTFWERNIHLLTPHMDFSELMDTMFLLQGNHDLVDCLDLRVTSKEFQKDSLIYAKAFLELGLKPKDIIAVSMPNFYQAIPIFKATNMLGAITTYLNNDASLEETIRYLNMYESKIFIASSSNCFWGVCPTKENIKNIIKEIKEKTKVEHVIFMDESLVNSRDFNQQGNYQVGNKEDISLHELESLSRFQKGKINTNYVKRREKLYQDALILYTSGSTTGLGKGIVYTNENLISACLYLKNSTHVPKPTDGDRRWMNIVSFMYPYGFGCSVLQTFLSGREVILSPNISEKNIVGYLKKGPNLIFGSPVNLEIIKRNLPKDLMLPSLHAYLSGGDILSAQASRDMIEFFAKHGATVKMYNSCGTGETMGTFTNAMGFPYNPNTVGRLVVGPDYLFIDENCFDDEIRLVRPPREVKYGERGIACISGPVVFNRYFNNPEEYAKVIFDYNGKKWYCSGNLCILDEKGNVELIGRASRFYIPSCSKKVYCEKIQAAVCAEDIIDTCAVVPQGNVEKVAGGKIYAVLRENLDPTEELKEQVIELSKQEFIDERTGEKVILAPYEIPQSVTFLKELPRTAKAGKINYELLKKMAEVEFYNNHPELLKGDLGYNPEEIEKQLDEYIYTREDYLRTQDGHLKRTLSLPGTNS